MLQRSLAQSEEDEEKLDAMGTQLRSQVKLFGTVQPTHCILGVRCDSKTCHCPPRQRKDSAKARRENKVDRCSCCTLHYEAPERKASAERASVTLPR